VHSHEPDAEVHDDCELCQSHGNVMSAEAEEFELVVEKQSADMRLALANKKVALKVAELKGMTEDMQEHLTYCDEEIQRLTVPVKQTTVQERLAALLAEEPDSDAEDDAKLEDYEEED
jgi:hypothetical protein